MTEARFLTPRPILTAKEREIAIAAIGARVSGSPERAAAQLLSGIAVLDGDHSPILVLPEGWSFQDAADWHDQQSAELRDRAQRFADRMNGVNSSARTSLEAHSDTEQTLSEPARTPRYPAACVPIHRGAETGGRSPEGQIPRSESSDAC